MRKCMCCEASDVEVMYNKIVTDLAQRMANIRANTEGLEAGIKNLEYRINEMQKTIDDYKKAIGENNAQMEVLEQTYEKVTKAYRESQGLSE